MTICFTLPDFATLPPVDDDPKILARLAEKFKQWFVFRF